VHCHSSFIPDGSALKPKAMVRAALNNGAMAAAMPATHALASKRSPSFFWFHFSFFIFLFPRRNLQ